MKSSLFALSVACLLTACGTTVGNPVVQLKSAPYSTQLNAGRVALSEFARLPDLSLALAAVNEFKFCVTKIKLEAEDGSFIQKDGSDEIEASLGLIDLSNASTSKTWGTIAPPLGGTMKELKIEIHKDSQICGGANYSARFDNGTNSNKEVTKDLEFQFTFAAPIVITAGSTFTLSIDAIAKAINDAASAGQFDDSNIDNFLQATTKGTAEKD